MPRFERGPCRRGRWRSNRPGTRRVYPRGLQRFGVRVTSRKPKQRNWWRAEIISKTRAALDRASGTALERHNIPIEEANNGPVLRAGGFTSRIRRQAYLRGVNRYRRLRLFQSQVRTDSVTKRRHQVSNGCEHFRRKSSACQRPYPPGIWRRDCWCGGGFASECASCRRAAGGELSGSHYARRVRRREHSHSRPPWTS